MAPSQNTNSRKATRPIVPALPLSLTQKKKNKLAASGSGSGAPTPTTSTPTSLSIPKEISDAIEPSRPATASTTATLSEQNNTPINEQEELEKAAIVKKESENELANGSALGSSKSLEQGRPSTPPTNFPVNADSAEAHHTMNYAHLPPHQMGRHTSLAFHHGGNGEVGPPQPMGFHHAGNLGGPINGGPPPGLEAPPAPHGRPAVPAPPLFNGHPNNRPRVIHGPHASDGGGGIYFGGYAPSNGSLSPGPPLAGGGAGGPFPPPGMHMPVLPHHEQHHHHPNSHHSHHSHSGSLGFGPSPMSPPAGYPGGAPADFTPPPTTSADGFGQHMVEGFSGMGGPNQAGYMVPSTPHSFHGSHSSAGHERESVMSGGAPFGYSHLPTPPIMVNGAGHIVRGHGNFGHAQHQHSLSAQMPPPVGPPTQQQPYPGMMMSRRLQPVPPAVDDLDDLASYLGTQFAQATFADCTLEVRAANDNSNHALLRLTAHKLILARSPTIRKLLTGEPDAGGSAAKPVFVLRSNDPYLRPDAFWVAAQRLYGLPLCDMGPAGGKGDGTNSSDDGIVLAGSVRERFDFALGYAAAGHVLQLPQVVLRGIELASLQVGWDTLDTAMEFAFGDALGHVQTQAAMQHVHNGGANYLVDGYGAEVHAPQHPAQMVVAYKYGGAVQLLVDRVVAFLAHKVASPGFVLDASVGNPATFARIPGHLLAAPEEESFHDGGPHVTPPSVINDARVLVPNDMFDGIRTGPGRKVDPRLKTLRFGDFSSSDGSSDKDDSPAMKAGKGRKRGKAVAPHNDEAHKEQGGTGDMRQRQQTPPMRLAVRSAPSNTTATAEDRHHNAILSRALLNLPFPVLKHVYETMASLGSVGGFNSIGNVNSHHSHHQQHPHVPGTLHMAVLNAIVAERERRRLAALEKLAVENGQGDDQVDGTNEEVVATANNAALVADLSWREEVVPDLVRRWAGSEGPAVVVVRGANGADVFVDANTTASTSDTSAAAANVDVVPFGGIAVGE